MTTDADDRAGDGPRATPPAAAAPETGEIARLRRELAASAAAIEELRLAQAGLQRRLSALEEQTARSQVRFDASVAYFEQRVDQIYARILAFLARRGDAAAVDDPFEGVPMSQVLTIAAADRMRLELEAAQGFLPPGRFRPPLTPFGFLMRLGSAREEGEAIHVAAESAGIVVYGPYKRLRVGRHAVRWTVAPAEEGAAGAVDLAFDVFSPGSQESLADVRHRGTLDAPLTLEMEVAVTPARDEATFELRAFQFGTTAFRILGLDLVPLPD